MKMTTIKESCSLHARIGWQGLTKKEYLDEGEYYLVTGVDFNNGHIAFENCHFVTKDRYDQDQHIQLSVDDVLVTKDGTIGKVAIIDVPIDKPATLNSGVFVVRPKDKKQLLPRYLMNVLQSNRFIRFIERIRVGCTIAHLNQEKFFGFDFPLPSVDEQRHIVSVFNSLTMILKQRQQELSSLNDLIKARFVEMFGDPVDNPKSWPIPLIEDVVSKEKNALKAGPFGSALKKEYYVKSGYKIYGQEQVISGDPNYGDYYIDEERYRQLENCTVQAGDVLISLVGTYGKLLIMPDVFEPGIINPRLMKITFDKSKVNPYYFQYYFQSDSLKESLANNTHGGTMDILNLSIVRKLKMPLPPIELQNKFVAFVAQVDKSKVAVERAIDETQLLFDSLMQKYFG